MNILPCFWPPLSLPPLLHAPCGFTFPDNICVRAAVISRYHQPTRVHIPLRIQTEPPSIHTQPTYALPHKPQSATVPRWNKWIFARLTAFTIKPTEESLFSWNAFFYQLLPSAFLLNGGDWFFLLLEGGTHAIPHPIGKKFTVRRQKAMAPREKCVNYTSSNH